MIDNCVPSNKLIFSSGRWELGLDSLQTGIKSEIAKVFENKSYPCIPALLSYQNDEYMVGSYSKFGVAIFAQELYRDLLYFAKTQKNKKSMYMSFWAIFTDEESSSEEHFETAMWKELSALCSVETPDISWDTKFSANPKDKNFCPSIGGDAFFVVGMHPHSSRIARKFKWPTMIFNLYEQFEELDRQGRYENIVQRNRARDIKLQGNINPMVEKYGDKWEAIQFSGKSNSADWKCPFHRAQK